MTKIDRHVDVLNKDGQNSFVINTNLGAMTSSVNALLERKQLPRQSVRIRYFLDKRHSV